MKILFRTALFFLLFLSARGLLAQPSSALIADAESGYLLIKDNVQEELAPASLTKVMTLYLTFAALEKGWLKWEDRLPVSVHAANQPRTNLNLQTWQTITVKEAVLSLIVHSANDAAVVLAEAMAPSEDEFAVLMTKAANMLNMKHTVFKNASGLHAEGQKTTAQDMAILTLAVIKHFPQYYPLFSTSSFDFNDHTYLSHNRILKEYHGAEGLKTGYVSAVGYNIISTAKQDNVRLVGVVMGQETAKKRDKKMAKLLDRAFKKVAGQKTAVNSGKLNPAFDPLHRRSFLQKMNLSLFSGKMQQQIKQAKLAADLLSERNTITKIQMSFEKDAFNSDGWALQVGAFKSLDSAKDLAARAFALLNQPNIHATTELNGGIYKAKLTGFSDRKCASNACKSLKKQSYACFLNPTEEAQGDK